MTFKFRWDDHTVLTIALLHLILVYTTHHSYLDFSIIAGTHFHLHVRSPLPSRKAVNTVALLSLYHVLFNG